MGALTDEEKSKVRYHLGYIASGTTASSIQFGIAQNSQTSYLLDHALVALTDPFALKRCRDLLGKAGELECALFAASGSLEVAKIGEVTLRDNLPDQLEKEYRRWTDRLADLFGVPKYHYSKRTERSGPGTVVKVRG